MNRESSQRRLRTSTQTVDYAESDASNVTPASSPGSGFNEAIDSSRTSISLLADDKDSDTEEEVESDEDAIVGTQSGQVLIHSLYDATNYCST